MDISKIDNSQIFTKTFANAVTNDFDQAPSSLKMLKESPFNIYLNKELGNLNDVNTRNKIMKMFVPEGNMKKPLIGNIQRDYSEIYIQGKKSQGPSKFHVLQQYKAYKEDQLLSNPGGDNFFVNKTTGVINNNYDHGKFSKRVGKDLADAASNLINAVKDIGFGAKFKYVDKNGRIMEAQKDGFLKTVSSFFKNVASGLSFGAYTPKGETKPVGVFGKVKHMFKKIFKEAVLDNVVLGVPKSVINVGEDLMFASLNTLEAIPDATIGNFKAGRKATTKIFDNAQVALDYATDILPGGEASGRTHSIKLAKGVKGLPIINNFTTSENGPDEPNWKYVRNTGFRKFIETIASFIPFRF